MALPPGRSLPGHRRHPLVSRRSAVQSVSPLPRLILTNLNCSRWDIRFVPNFDFAFFSRPDILGIGENGVVHKLENAIATADNQSALSIRGRVQPSNETSHGKFQITLFHVELFKIYHRHCGTIIASMCSKSDASNPYQIWRGSSQTWRSTGPLKCHIFSNNVMYNN